MSIQPSAQARFAPLDLDFTHAPFEGSFVAGERVCPPGRVPRLQRSSWGSSFLVLALLGAAAWAFVNLPQSWRRAVFDWTSAMVQQALAHHEAPPEPSPPMERRIASAPEPLASQEVASAAGAQAGTLVSEQPSAATHDVLDAPQGAVKAPTGVTPEPLPPPLADPADPLQRRALAIGLHPDLSRAVLARFSQRDWRNAEQAIQRALTGPRDTQTLTWPRTASADSAQFEVRFVEAAGAGCRRYVVTVTKDRWTTTARAMELCGDALPQREASRSPAAKPGG